MTLSLYCATDADERHSHAWRADAGVRLQRYAGMGQDEQGVWTSPSGARIAWLKDPDGNTLSITHL